MTLPLILPAFFAGLGVVFIRSMTAISATIFLVSIGWTLITVKILENMTELSLGPAAAFSVLVVVIVFVVIAAIGRAAAPLPRSRRSGDDEPPGRMTAMSATGRPKRELFLSEGRRAAPRVPNDRGIDRRGCRRRIEALRASRQGRGLRRARRRARTCSPGEFLTLLGPSGCGKTTTLRMIAGYEMPDAGRIRFGGQDVTREPANRRNIGFVFQNYALFPHLSIFENVAYGLQRARHCRGRREAAASAKFWRSSASPATSSSSRASSRRRAAAGGPARAIVIRPRVLLFDEPLSNLDAKLRVQMRTEIRELQRTLAITTVYVTHDQEEAMAVSDRIAVMNEGSVVQEGTAEDLYHRPASQFVAQFVGRVNLVPGRVMEIAGGTVESRGARRDDRCARRPRGSARGDAVRLVVRPEAIAIAAAAPATGPLQATVTSRTFLGEKIEYLLRCADETLQVVRYDASPGEIIAEGANVTVRFADGAVTVLPEAAARAIRCVRHSIA